MKTWLYATAKSWKTTAVAFILAVNATLSAVGALLDSDAATNPDWNLVVALYVAAFGMLFARDADKTSKDSKLGQAR